MQMINSQRTETGLPAVHSRVDERRVGARGTTFTVLFVHAQRNSLNLLMSEVHRRHARAFDQLSVAHQMQNTMSHLGGLQEVQDKRSQLGIASKRYAWQSQDQMPRELFVRR